MAAYREHEVEPDYFLGFLEVGKTHPGYAIVDEAENVIGFCMLKPHIALSTFSQTAEIMYFIDPEFTGRGVGSAALARLERDAKDMGITKILASISSENEGSQNFHRKNGFVEYGRFPDIGKKFGRRFGVIWMGKEEV
jgi:phosphinothricin acetyltransferase